MTQLAGLNALPFSACVVIALRPRDKPHNNNSLMQEAKLNFVPPCQAHGPSIQCVTSKSIFLHLPPSTELLYKQ